jgi:Carboxypeptidase regulatory-like domain
MSSEGRFRFTLLPLALAALAVLCGALSGAAQADGDVRAQVQDGQGSPVAGIQITLMKAGGQSQQKAADAEGKVHFNGLAGGVYIVTAAPDGYAEVTCPGVRVVGQSRQLEIRLMPKDGPEPSSCKVVAASAG